MESATAGVQSAEAQLKQETATYQRQKALIDAGFTTRTSFDQAEQSLRTAQASLDSANNQRKSAENQLNYPILKAGESGVITARFAEVGHVVEQARAIFSIAKDGPRDAVFDVYEAIFAQVPDVAQTEITLVSNPKVTAEGTVREIAPAVDTNSGTVRVKIGIPLRIAPLAPTRRENKGLRHRDDRQAPRQTLQLLLRLSAPLHFARCARAANRRSARRAARLPRPWPRSMRPGAATAGQRIPPSRSRARCR